MRPLRARDRAPPGSPSGDCTRTIIAGSTRGKCSQPSFDADPHRARLRRVGRRAAARAVGVAAVPGEDADRVGQQPGVVGRQLLADIAQPRAPQRRVAGLASCAGRSSAQYEPASSAPSRTASAGGSPAPRRSTPGSAARPLRSARQRLTLQVGVEQQHAPAVPPGVAQPLRVSRASRCSDRPCCARAPAAAPSATGRNRERAAGSPPPIR